MNVVCRLCQVYFLSKCLNLVNARMKEGWKLDFEHIKLIHLFSVFLHVLNWKLFE
jgi:hypothetical protein